MLGVSGLVTVSVGVTVNKWCEAERESVCVLGQAVMIVDSNSIGSKKGVNGIS